MRDDVKICVNSRKDFFEKYYTVPDRLKAEVEKFIEDITALGERSQNAMEFEQAFQNEGYSEKFNNLLMGCVPKPVQMTDEQKEYSQSVMKDLNKDRDFKKEFFDDVKDHVQTELNEELIAKRREIMTETGVFDEYTKVSNAVDDGGRLFGFFKKRFKK